MGDAVDELIEMDHLIESRIAHDLRDEGYVHGVAGALGRDLTEDGAADEGEVADEVEDFVTNGLIGEAEAFGVEDAGGGEADGVVEGGAADEAHVAHLVELVFEAEGAGRGDLFGVAIGSEIESEFLAANEGVVEVDVAVEREAIGRGNTDAFAVAFDGDLAGEAEVFAGAAEGLGAGLAEEMDPGEAGAVEDGDFEVIDLDDGVVDLDGVKSAEKVFGGGDEDALAHEAGGVADTGDVTEAGGDLEAFEVGAAEDDAGASGGGEDVYAGRNTMVEADAFGRDGSANCGFKLQESPPGMRGTAKSRRPK